MRRLCIELVTDAADPTRHSLMLVTADESKLLGTIKDRGGWAVGTISGQPGEWDASKVEDVVTAILTERADMVSHLLVEWGEVEE